MPTAAGCLYADQVKPERLPATGGPIAIRGMGFHAADTVLVGGRPAQVTSVSPNEITAIAPPAAAGVTGSVDVEVDDQPVYYAIAVISGGLSYDSAKGDALTLVTAPANTVPIGVPLPFAVTALGPALDPAGGVSITYSVVQGQRQPELRQAIVPGHGFRRRICKHECHRRGWDFVGGDGFAH